MKKATSGDMRERENAIAHLPLTFNSHTRPCCGMLAVVCSLLFLSFFSAAAAAAAVVAVAVASARYKDKNINVFTPKNTHSVRLLFRAKKAAKVVGELASSSARDGKLLSGVFVQKGDYSQSMILAPSDLSTYTQLTTRYVCVCCVVYACLYVCFCVCVFLYSCFSLCVMCICVCMSVRFGLCVIVCLSSSLISLSLSVYLSLAVCLSIICCMSLFSSLTLSLSLSLELSISLCVSLAVSLALCMSASVCLFCLVRVWAVSFDLPRSVLAPVYVPVQYLPPS
jgi:hypothetical protein